MKATSSNSTSNKGLKVGETRSITHAPSHLPSLPDPHTYIKTFVSFFILQLFMVNNILKYDLILKILVILFKSVYDKI